MAYSLNDPYRLYRLVLRVTALGTGLGFGLLLIVRPQLMGLLWGWHEPAAYWALRLGGAGLAGMGVALLEISWRPVIARLTSLTVMLCNGTMAGILFSAYVGDGLALLHPAGRILLWALFLGHLACVVLPLSYLGDDLKP